MLPRRSLSNATRSSLLDQVRRRSWVSVDKMLEILNHWIFFGQIQHQLDSIVAIYIGKIMIIHWNWEYQANSWGPNFWGNTEVFRCGIMVSNVSNWWARSAFRLSNICLLSDMFSMIETGRWARERQSTHWKKHVFVGVLWNWYILIYIYIYMK